MSKYNSTCSLCYNPTIADTLLRAEACRFRGNPRPYAASETHLSPVSLPSMHSKGFMGASFDGEACHAGDSVVSTVLVVCHSVKNIDCVIHIVNEGQMNPSELTEVTSRCMGEKESIVLSVSPSNDHMQAIFSIYSSLAPDGTIVDEASAMRILLSVLSISKGMVWYWSVGLLGYSHLLNVDNGSMWALSFEPNKLENCTDNLKVMMPSGKESVTRVLPFFYCKPDSPTVVVMGKGGVNSFCKSDLAVEVTALSRIGTDRAYCSTTSSGRCFCCEYLDCLHSSFHTRDRQSSDIVHKLELSRQFWQNTKRR